MLFAGSFKQTLTHNRGADCYWNWRKFSVTFFQVIRCQNGTEMAPDFVQHFSILNRTEFRCQFAPWHIHFTHFLCLLLFLTVIPIMYDFSFDIFFRWWFFCSFGKWKSAEKQVSRIECACVWLPNWKPPKPCSKPLSFYTATWVIEWKHYNCLKRI